MIEGYTILGMIGEGAAGAVYEASRADGTRYAVKVFETMSSNCGLLASRVERLIEAGAHEVTVPIVAHALNVRPSCVIMPLLGDSLEDGSFSPRTLQVHLREYFENERTWPFLLKLAESLGVLHGAKVAHGNLKPGNIFLSPSGDPLLADYASGLMPGVHHLGYTDALLYAAPEQLIQPGGYLEEAGYRADVYAFGVMAYRLLTGRYPRCHEIFETVTPSAGTLERFSIEADQEGIAQGLWEDGEVSWPTEAEDEREGRRRELILECLSLDPLGRPLDLLEVTRRFAKIDEDLAVEAERRRLEGARVRAVSLKRRANLRFATAVLVAAGLGLGWGWTVKERWSERALAKEKFDDYEAAATSEIRALGEERDGAKRAEAAALAGRVKAEAALAEEQGKAEEELRMAQITNERLFDWLLEEGIEGLPVLENRGGRLKWLEKRIDYQLQGMAERPTLAPQAAILRLRRAEVALAAGDLEQGEKWLKEAVADERLPEGLSLRGRLRLVLLESKSRPTKVRDDLANLREMVSLVWKEDEGKRLRGLAAIDLVEARAWEAEGDFTKAREGYLASLAGYRKLEENFSDQGVIGMLVGKRYLDAARSADGEGAFENSAKLRAEAAKAFESLAEKVERPTPELEFQIVSASAARALSLWQQGDVFGAEKLARENVGKLTRLAEQLSGDFRVIFDLASQKGILATALRDEGKRTEAQSILVQGIGFLEDGLKKENENFGARYLLASLRWQLAGLYGQAGEGNKELELGEQSRLELLSILSSEVRSPRPGEIRKSLAYLCGDLGHSADLNGQRDLAVKYFEESKKCWQELVRDEGDEMEYREGYHWVVGRLAEIGVK